MNCFLCTCKYENAEDNKSTNEDAKEDSADIRSYMDNSSSRIETLLKIAADEDKETIVPTEASNESSVIAKKYYEEQSGDSVEAVTIGLHPSISAEESNSGNTQLLYHHHVHCTTMCFINIFCSG